MKRSIFRAVAVSALVPAFLAAQTTVTGAGASFPKPMYDKWFSDYHKAHPDIEINYSGPGSGAGIKQVTEGTVDFGASDGPMNDAQLAEYKSKHGGHDILHFPTVMGAVVPIYNIPGVTGKLKFTGPVLAGIYLGTITKWNDASITKLNPGIKLPASDIVVVHRSDGSGTSYIFTDYLSKVSADWKSKVGATNNPTWPTGLGGAQNPGVAGLVKQTEGAIGYVELIFALQNQMSFGDVQNASGEFVTASLAGVSAAAAGAAASMPEDFRVSITNAPGKGVYPISSFTWLLIPSRIDDAGKRKVITDFVKWMLADGQNMTETLSYAKLPPAVVSKELKALSKVQ